MTRFIGFVLVLASGCNCRSQTSYARLSKYCGPGTAVVCPSEADAIAETLRTAEATWLGTGACEEASVGTWSFGTWVDPNTVGSFCGSVLFFSRSGALLGERNCCETRCSEFGLSPFLSSGPQTRDLCREARRSLVVRGARLSGAFAQAVLASDGGTISLVGKDWLLPFGSWTAMLPRDAGTFGFTLSEDDDAGLVLYGAPEPWVRYFRHRRHPDDGTELPPWLTLPDGGSGPIPIRAAGKAY